MWRVGESDGKDFDSYRCINYQPAIRRLSFKNFHLEGFQSSLESFPECFPGFPKLSRSSKVEGEWLRWKSLPVFPNKPFGTKIMTTTARLYSSREENNFLEALRDEKCLNQVCIELSFANRRPQQCRLCSSRGARKQRHMVHENSLRLSLKASLPALPSSTRRRQKQ